VDKQEGENIKRYSQNNINDEFLNQNFKVNIDICVIAEKPSPKRHFEGTKDGNECSHNQCWYDIEAQP
jgi:Holliday junction resolvase RusA-like endonuclease